MHHSQRDPVRFSPSLKTCRTFRNLEACLLFLLLLSWCFTALRHFSCHFGCDQLTYPHCSWASLLGSLPVLSVHSFASNLQLSFLNQRKAENGCSNYSMINKNVAGREDATIRMPGGRASEGATAPGLRHAYDWKKELRTIWATSQENLSSELTTR